MLLYSDLREGHFFPTSFFHWKSTSTLMIRSRVRVPLLLLFFFLLHQPCYSFSDSPVAVAYPSRSKSLSWKPRYPTFILFKKNFFSIFWPILNYFLKCVSDSEHSSTKASLRTKNATIWFPLWGQQYVLYTFVSVILFLDLNSCL